MKTIIVPTDFSAVSANAASYAAALAERVHTTITLFHAFPIPLTFSEVPVPPQVVDTLQKDAEELMEKAKQHLQLATQGAININTVIRPGMFLSGLRELCDETEPYAVVMSSHGTAGLEQVLLGSETSATVKHLPWPLIVVPRGAKFRSPKKVALACDFEKVHSSIPAGLVRDLVHNFNANLYVLHVHDRERPYKEGVIEGTSDLYEMLADLHPFYEFIEGKDVTEAILDFVEKNDIDLLIGFPKKRNFLVDLFHKSKSKAIARETPVPFLSLHEK